jgi:hypothetical protein
MHPRIIEHKDVEMTTDIFIFFVLYAESILRVTRQEEHGLTFNPLRVTTFKS